MLNQINISDFTIIEKLELSFNGQMTVLTGETGAGKSIVIDALALVLGARAESRFVRHGADHCDISVSFDVTQIPAALAWLHEHDLVSDDDCLLRRVISQEGRSKSYINAKPATLQQLRQLGSLLVNIHGQHEYQNLLKPDLQRKVLDDFAGHTVLVKTVAEKFQAFEKNQKALIQLKENVRERTSRMEFLRFQVQELDDLGLVENEVESLGQEHKQLAVSEDLIESCQTALHVGLEGETATITGLLNRITGDLEAFSSLNPQLKSVCELLASATIQVGEAMHELRHVVDAIDPDPQRLQTVEQRLEKIHDIARKHHVAPHTLPQLHRDLHLELSHLENSDEQLETLEQASQTFFKAYLTSAKKLSKSRANAGNKLSELVTSSIHQLGMGQGHFEVQISSDEQAFHRAGLDRIEFLVSANPGQPMQALKQVASGGELSRISLAIQVITAECETTPTLIFDEVDTGIGGSTAEIVGQLLRALGERTQVICITHLPQVAAKGHHHWQVEKSMTKQATRTRINVLDPGQRVQEIARMLGGVKITSQTVAHATEMLMVD